MRATLIIGSVMMPSHSARGDKFKKVTILMPGRLLIRG